MTSLHRLDLSFVEARAAALKLEIQLSQGELDAWCDELNAAAPDVDDDALFTYRVPELSEDGACSLAEALEEEPFDLRAVLRRAAGEERERLKKLRHAAEVLSRASGANWCGIYQYLEKAPLFERGPGRGGDGGPALVKVAYVGAPSRAIFPVNATFAQKSNNTASLMRREVLLIRDVHAHIAEGGAYYECDAKVRSELCVPLLGYAGSRDDARPLGLIDCESFSPDYFSGEIAGRVLVVGEWLIRAGLL